jgi:hypothetical protein
MELSRSSVFDFELPGCRPTRCCAPTTVARMPAHGVEASRRSTAASVGLIVDKQFGNDALDVA